MRTKTKTVCYCDYCRKHTLTINSMKLHERYCTCNLSRACAMCETSSFYNSAHLRSVVDKFLLTILAKEKKEFYGVVFSDIKQPKAEDLMDAVEGCPICCLTVIKALKRKNEFVWIEDFHYKEEVQKWWDEKNEECGEDNTYLLYVQKQE